MTTCELKVWREARRARSAERREAAGKIYWLRVHLRLLVFISVIYLVALIALDQGVAWSLSVALFGVSIVALVFGSWASPRKG